METAKLTHQQIFHYQEFHVHNLIGHSESLFRKEQFFTEETFLIAE